MSRNRILVLLASVACFCLVFAAGLGFGRAAGAAPAAHHVARSTPHYIPIPYHPSHNPAYAALQQLVDWPEIGFDATGARNNTSETILSVATVSQLQTQPSWSAPVLYSFLPSAIVLQGNIYAPSISYDSTPQIVAYNGTTGAPVWSAPPFVGREVSGLAGANGTVYIADNDSRLYAFDASSGAETGEHLYTNPLPAALTILNGVAYMGTGQNFDAINLKNGKILWSVLTGNGSGRAPAVVGGVVYWAGDDNRMYAINASNGTVLWSRIVPGGFGGTNVAVVGNLIYIRDHDNVARALSTADGSVVWTDAAGGSNDVLLIAVGNGSVFKADRDADGNWGVFAYNALTGVLEWEGPTSGPGVPTLANGVLYTTDSAGTAYAFDASGCGQGQTICQPLWTGTGWYGTQMTYPIVVNGRLYLASGGGIYEFQLP